MPSLHRPLESLWACGQFCQVHRPPGFTACRLAKQTVSYRKKALLRSRNRIVATHAVPIRMYRMYNVIGSALFLSSNCLFIRQKKSVRSKWHKPQARPSQVSWCFSSGVQNDGYSSQFLCAYHLGAQLFAFFIYSMNVFGSVSALTTFCVCVCACLRKR